jgi:exodeoxyribonuclease VII large subunit
VRLNIYKQAHVTWQNHLELLNPQRTLERGYAVLINQEGQAIRGLNELKLGEVVDLHLAQGQADVVFSEINRKI